MKVCPKCGTAASDDSQAYCLMDGTPLVDAAAASEPTLVMDRSQATVTTQRPPKKRTGLWIALGLGALIALVGLGGLLILLAYRMGTESAAARVNVNGNSPGATKPGGTPRSTPQTSPSGAASPETTPAANDAPSADEPTPISWSASAGFVKQETGLRYTFQCAPDGTAGMVWGSDVYTADSSICTAAVHAGKITLERGGTITIEFTGGRQTYGATTRNGITTYNYGQYPHSFVVRDGGKSD